MDFVFRRTYRGPVQALVLDWAGTSVDYGCCAPAVVFVEVFKRHQVPLTMAQAREPMGAAKKDHIRALLDMEAVSRAWVDTHGRPPQEADVEALYREFIPLQVDILDDYSDLIPGAREAMADFRQRGLKVGTSTGYNREMLAVVLAAAREQGFEPDTAVSAGDVPAGRPAPWMCLQNALQLQVYPLEAYVKIGDTAPDIEAGLNAGMWTIGLAVSGNEVGLSEADLAALPAEERDRRRARAYQRLSQAGAHYVVDTIAETPSVLDRINERLRGGERP